MPERTSIWSRPLQKDGKPASAESISAAERLGGLSQAVTNIEQNVERIDRNVTDLRSDMGALHRAMDTSFADQTKKHDETYELLDERLTKIEQQQLIDEAEMRGRWTVVKAAISIGSALAAVAGWAVGTFFKS